jgi:hypothetical protein
MKTTEIKMKEIVNETIELLNDEQINFIYDLLTLGTFPSKGDLLILSGKDREYQRRIDTATPIDYYRRIEDIYPGIKNGNMCYDYNHNTYGEMTNINDLIVQRMLNVWRFK